MVRYFLHICHFTQSMLVFGAKTKYTQEKHRLHEGIRGSCIAATIHAARKTAYGTDS